MTEWKIARLDELERFPTGWGGVWRPVRRHFDVRAFGVNAWTGENAGDHVIERHSEPDGPEELYVVFDGRATFTIGDETVDAPRGSFVYVPPGTFREAVAAEPGTTVLALGAKRGEVFEPSAWEEWAVADAYRNAGDLERARSIMRDLVDRSPDVWQAHYNRACFESVAGDADQAFESLRRAVELDADEVRRITPGDPDFDAIRNDPRYTEVIG
ncbi:MAG TPA: cupin domain-containing protein [Gaiellaceae bacterium]|jgi:quercetin dioxygenase-like cupin family protein